MSTKISKSKREKIFLKTGGRCAYCGKHLIDIVWHVEHIHPKYKGGRNDIDNLFASCPNCNARKNRKSLDEFRIVEYYRSLGAERLGCNLIRDFQVYGLVPQAQVLTDAIAQMIHQASGYKFYFESYAI